MKKITKVLMSLLVASALLLVKGQNVLAYEVPSFPTCSNPGGTLTVSYNDGTHGIVGSSATYVGSDKVYSLVNGNALQCFCATDGSGIQTSWWKVSSLTQDEIQTLKNLGWYFVPDGAAWGLQSGPYMATNNNYSCTNSNPGNPTTPAGAPVCNADQPSAPVLLSVQRNGSSATITWSKSDKATHYVIAYGTVPGLYPYGVPNTGNVTSFTINALDPNKKYYFEVIAVNDCMPSQASSNQGGQVLGLATTGTLEMTLILAVLGLALTSTGYLLSRSKSN